MPICKIRKCNKKSSGLGYCPMHYARFKGYTKVKLNLPHQRPNHGSGKIIDKDGYSQIRINDKYRREHRFIMENHLGRKLLRNEAVHHINKDKLDNRIENLEVISFSEHRKIHSKITNDVIKEVVRLYLNGMSAPKITNYVNICYSAVYRCLIFSGIQIRGSGERNLKKGIIHATYKPKTKAVR